MLQQAIKQYKWHLCLLHRKQKCFLNSICGNVNRHGQVKVERASCLL